MAHDFPTDLIQQVKAATRAEAGLPNYNPTADLPPLPSISETVAALDPSPPYLRCKSCKGRLLRGVQSLLCIYCGRPNDVTPGPISFKDTIAYRWLLESLHVDGSEMVGPPPTERSELKRGANTSKDEIPLSDFLDMKLTWPAEVEEKQIGASNKKQEQRSSLNLMRVDLDNFFSESSRINVSNTPEEQAGTSNHDETTEKSAVASHHKLSFFQYVQPSESAIPSSEDKNDVSFSGWEADFQSADSGDQFGGSKSVDPFMGSHVTSENHHDSPNLSDPFNGAAVDLSLHLDSVFGTIEDLKDKKTKDDSATSPSIGDWNSDDLLENLNSKVSQPTGQFDETVGDINALPEDNPNHLSTSVDWFQVDHLQANNANAPTNKTNVDDDLFSDWNDFTSSNSVQESSGNAGTESHNQSTAVLEKTSELNLFSSDNNLEDMDFGGFSQADAFPSSSGKEREVNDIQLQLSSQEREGDTKSGIGNGAGQAAVDGDVNSGYNQQIEDVEMLFSQMHDLSFMLESNLSLPPKSDGVNSFP